jgi:hypothetical protein
MKTLLLTLCLALSFISIAQQKEPSISLGPSIGIPSDFRGNWGSGASLRGYIGTSKRGAVLVNANTLFYPYSYKSGTSNVSMLKVGYKTQLLHPKLFFYGDAGVARTRSSSTKTIDPAAGIGVGYTVLVGERKYIDITPSWNFKLRQYPNPWLTYSSKLELHFAYRIAIK